MIKKVSYQLLRPLLIEAEESSCLKGMVYPEKEDLERMAIMSNDEIVGFFAPRLESDLIWRVGAIYVKPEFRSKGFALLAIKEFLEGKKARAFIEIKNESSLNLFKKAGFRKVQDDNENGGAWFEKP